MSKVGTVTVMGQELELHASEVGTFTLLAGDERIATADTLEQAKTRARTALNKRRVRVEVPFVLLDGRRGIATGRNLRTPRDLNVEIDGKKDQLPRYGRSVLKPDIPEETLRELQEHTRLVDEHAEAARRIEGEWQLALASAVDRAVAEAAEAKTREAGE